MSGNQGLGLSINASSSVISVKNSVFDNNKYQGIRLNGNSIILENLVASGNKETGIELNGKTSVIGKYLNLDANGSDGIKIDTCAEDAGVCTNLLAGTVTLNNIGSSNNVGSGVNISTVGSVTLLEGYMGDNGGKGIYIDSAASKILPAVTITNVEVARNNENGIGLLVKGPVTLEEFQCI